MKALVCINGFLKLGKGSPFSGLRASNIFFQGLHLRLQVVNSLTSDAEIPRLHRKLLFILYSVQFFLEGLNSLISLDDFQGRALLKSL